MPKNLVIVESPAKARTISKILGEDYVIKSCNGHIRDLHKKDLSIDKSNKFMPNYEILPEKSSIISELRESVKSVEKVLLATDEDREGEAISWHLVEVLKLKEDKTERIVFHEITKNALHKALENPRYINYNLVNAQQARRVLDRLVGYELSPLLWKKIKPELSAGRVQSVAVKLIVERENEINKFNSESKYKISGRFAVKNKIEKILIAELNHRFCAKEEAMQFLEQCIGAQFRIISVETKPSFKSPPPPFITSSLQQEASRKLGFSVSKTMLIAQNLYETGKITYMRTDSVNLSDVAMSACKKEIEKLFGKEYSEPRKYTTKVKGAQEAHEAIRPTYISVQEAEGTKDEKSLYNLIWKRTIASQMSSAKIEKTLVDISSPNESYVFQAKGEVILFEGFLKIYSEIAEDEEQQEEINTLPKVKPEDILEYQYITGTEKFSHAPYRYGEPGLVKKLEELGIGRPSTYAPIISTIQKREYVSKRSNKGYTRNYIVLTLTNKTIKETVSTETVGAEKNKLHPTDLGIIVTDFLNENFIDIMDYHFTANVEKQFDEIALGDVEWTTMIQNFYDNFNPLLDKTSESKKFTGERLLGKDPETGFNVYAKMGRYGPIVQVGETGGSAKPKFASLLKHQSIQSITLEEALSLFKFPIVLGKHEDENVIVNVGPYGPYVKFQEKCYQIPEDINPLNITMPQSLEIISRKKQAQNKNVVIKSFDSDDLTIYKGKWGPYIKCKNQIYSVPKKINPSKLSKEECMKIINESSKKKHNKKK